jgi:hypothetical protein
MVKPIFFSFLQMCFFFVGSATSQMQKEIQELWEGVADLQSKRVSSHDAAYPQSPAREPGLP